VFSIITHRIEIEISAKVVGDMAVRRRPRLLPADDKYPNQMFIVIIVIIATSFKNIKQSSNNISVTIGVNNK